MSTLYKLKLYPRDAVEQFFGSDNPEDWFAADITADFDVMPTAIFTVVVVDRTAEWATLKIVDKNTLEEARTKPIKISNGQQFKAIGSWKIGFGDFVAFLAESEAQYPDIGEAFSSLFYDPADPPNFTVHAVATRGKGEMSATIFEDNVPRLRLRSDFGEARRIDAILEKYGYSIASIPFGKKNAIKTPSWRIWAE